MSDVAWTNLHYPSMTRRRRAHPTEMVGCRVRARLDGVGVGDRIRHRAPDLIPWRATIYGLVIGWEWPAGEDPMVLIAGYGRVPMDACRVWPWWLPWPL